MSFRSAHLASAALFYVFSTQTALADLTAQDVWSDWQNYLAGSGYEVTANEQMSGDTLTISDLTMKMVVDDNAGNAMVVIPSISLTQNNDGSVSTTFPSPMTIPFELSNEKEDGAVSGELVYSHEGTDYKITGDPSNMAYAYSSAQIALAVKSIVVEGKALPENTLKMNVSMTNVAGTMMTKLGNLRGYDHKLTAGSLTYDIAFDDPDSDEQGTFDGALRGIDAISVGLMPLEMDPNDLTASLENGLMMQGTLNYAAGHSDIQGIADGQSIAVTSTSQGGGIGFSMDKSLLSYDLNGTDTALTVETDSLPFPVSVNMAKSSLRVAMPTMKSPDPQDFAFGLTLGEFTMSDMIWAMFDPAAQLPRDPATVELDLTGRATVVASLLDLEDAEILSKTDGMPGELNALTINKFLVSLVGARLSGDGNFTFDNGDTETFDGLPKPTGAIDLQLVGANGLIDKLIAMGFIAEQEALGARMMMGMIGVPGSEPDTLNSKIEINEQGHVLANGQRLK